MPSEPDLVRAAAAGDREAFGDLYRRFGRLVHGVVLARVAPQEAEDLVQEVFLAALGQIHSLRRHGSVGAWLVTIARRRVADHYRRAPAEKELADPEPDTRALPRERAEAEAALAAIGELPEAYRETLMLRLVEGYTGPEIARLTGLTPGSVRVNLHRGMKLLRTRLGVGTDG